MRLIPGAISKYQLWQFPWGIQNMDVEPSSCIPAYLELLHRKELTHVDICLKAFNIHVLQFWIFWITPQHRCHLILSHQDFFHQSQTGESICQFNNQSAHTPISWHLSDHSIQSKGLFTTWLFYSDLTGKVLTPRSQFYHNNICCTFTILHNSRLSHMIYRSLVFMIPALKVWLQSRQLHNVVTVWDWTWMQHMPQLKPETAFNSPRLRCPKNAREQQLKLRRDDSEINNKLKGILALLLFLLFFLRPPARRDHWISSLADTNQRPIDGMRTCYTVGPAVLITRDLWCTTVLRLRRGAGGIRRK